MQLRSEHSIGIFHIRINWLFAACVLMTVAAFGRLGIWQLDRASEKVEAQQTLQIESSLNAEPLEENSSRHLHRANPDIQNRHVLLRGEYVNDRTILLLAEFFQGDDRLRRGDSIPAREQRSAGIG